MTILKRYVLKQFLQFYCLTLVGLIGIFMVIDCFERLDEFVSKNAPWSDFFFYYLYKIPFIFSYMAPQSVLLATVITLATLAKNNEFIAMKASGISVTGITLPILGCSVFIALFVVGVNEWVTHKTSSLMNYIYHIKVRQVKTEEAFKKDNLWVRSKNGAIWNIRYYDARKKAMTGVSLFYYDKYSSHFRQRVDAQSVNWDGLGWVFKNGSIRRFKRSGVQNTEFFEERKFPLTESPSDFIIIEKRPEELNARQMYKTIKLRKTEGVDTTALWVDLHAKLSYPFSSVVLALIGIPLSLRSSRNGGVLFCISVSLAISFIFSFLYAMGISLGHGGTLGPVISAWGPSALFIAIGFYLLLTLDSETLIPARKT